MLQPGLTSAATNYASIAAVINPSRARNLAHAATSLDATSLVALAKL